MNKFTNFIQALPFLPVSVRKAILKFAGIKIGTGAVIYGQTFFGSHKCEIGENSFISIQCIIDGSEWVRIGRDVQIAMGVKLITSSHKIGPSIRRAGPALNAPVIIGDGCWLGASSMVLPGVEIAKGCIIAAGAVVAKSTTPNGLYVGIPAKRIKELDF